MFRPFSLPAFIARFVAVTALTLAAILPVGSSATSAAETRRPLRIMPLGDSITSGNGWQGPNAYRGPLWDLALDASIPIDFVGSQKNDQDTMGDTDMEGYGGIQIQEIEAKVPSAMRTYHPDVILLHIGTNNIWREGELPTVAPQRLSKLVDTITASAPWAQLYVASIVPSVEHEKNVQLYNQTIPSMVQKKVAQGKKVHYVNIHDALDFDNLIDGIHPNTHGYKIMAQKWWEAMNLKPSV